eukprot:gene4811-6740_t
MDSSAGGGDINITRLTDVTMAMSSFDSDSQRITLGFSHSGDNNENNNNENDQNIDSIADSLQSDIRLDRQDSHSVPTIGNSDRNADAIINPVSHSSTDNTLVINNESGDVVTPQNILVAGFSMSKCFKGEIINKGVELNEQQNINDSVKLPISDGGSLNGNSFESNTWSECEAGTFSMRIGPNYNKFKKKAPSAKSLYDLAGVDFIKCSRRIDNFASYVKIPDEWKSIDTHHPGIPPVIVVNTQLPSDFSSSFFKEITDGDGWSLVIYFKITQETADALADLSTAAPAIQLFANYCMNAPEAQINANQTPAVVSKASKFLSNTLASATGIDNNPWMGKFKVTLRCENIEQFNLPSFISSYNAKPVLIRNTGNLIRSSDGSYMEMDINVHRFGSVPKKALEVLFNRFDQMVISMGFCIESREENEMPEILFGTATLHQPTHTMAYKWSN